MKTCKSCKWWDGEVGGYCKRQDYVDESLIAVAETSEDYSEMPLSNGLLARYNEDSCIILTGPDFGCIHHEAKE